MRNRGVGAAAAVLAATAATAVPVQAAAPRVTAVRAPTRVAAGTRLTVSVKARPATARLTVLLSKDARRGHDVTLGSGRARKGHLTVTVPRRTKPARYHLLVCAGHRCTAAHGLLRVTAPKATTGAPTVGAQSGAAPPAPSPKPVLPAAPNPMAGLPSLATAPDPVAIHPSADAAHAASAIVGAAGGTLDATGADGSTFRLVVPAGALLGDETITMTPVGAIADLPLTTAPAAAVQLGPDGLSLLKPASLTIVPAHPAPVPEQTGFGWHGAGDDFHLEPIGTDPAKVVLDLWHFSGAGVAGATSAELAAQQQHLPQTEQDRFSQQVAQILNDARAYDAHATPQQLQDEAVQAYDNVVAPLMQAAGSDDGQLDVAVRTALSWAGNLEKLGAGADAAGPLGARLQSALTFLAAALDRGYQAARTACLGGDLAKGLRMLQLGRERAVLGAPEGTAVEDLAKCERFTLNATSQLHVSGAVLEGSWALKDVVLEAGPDGRMQTDATPTDGQMSPEMWGDCSETPTGYDPGPAAPVRLDLDWNLTTEKGPDGRERTKQGPVKLSVLFGYFEPIDHYTASCPKGGTVASTWAPWDVAFLFATSSVRTDDGFRYDGLPTSSNGGIVVDKTDDVSNAVGGATVHHVFHFTIAHTPRTS